MALVHGFELLQDTVIAELDTRAQIYRHQKTGALLLSLQNDDENKSFCIGFRTPPKDSTGVAHILEHSVLSGSRKYPLKDPFAELVKGSLKTFLNAMTYPDKTVYPVASTNLQDFYNLVDVYLDTVFNPLLRRETLLQEGWHYELEKPEDPLIYKGVVFNEMKGVYSSPDSVLGRFTQQAIFPDTTYGVDSGGDPREIPHLTYEQFLNFHHTFYHPSNAHIVFYGDDDPQERLRILDDYLSAFEPIVPHSEIALQQRFATPRQEQRAYAGEAETPGARKSYVNVAWMLETSDNPETDLGLAILDHILIGTSAAPLRKALIDSGLGENLTGSGLSDDYLQMTYWVGLKGIAAESGSQVELLVLDTLEQLVRDGIDAKTIEASLNTVEFSLRENNTGSFPRGLALALEALNRWNYDLDPVTSLSFEAPLAAIKARIAKGERFFESLIKSHLLDNSHRVTVLLSPDPELHAREEAEERAELDAAKAAMSAEDIQQVIGTTHRLREMQETPDSPEKLALLPSLKLSDLDRESKSIPIEVEDREGTRILLHDLFTNGIIYLDVGFNLRDIPQHLLPYVPLFSRSLLELGTASEDSVSLAQRIGRTTGGIRPQSFFSSPVKGSDAVAWLFLRGKATLAQSQELLGILHDVLLTVKLDNRDRFRQLVLESKASHEAALVPQGHAIVNTRLRRHFNVADWAAEQTGGISYLLFLRQLAQQVEQDWSSVQAALEAIRTILVNRSRMIVNVTQSAEDWKSFAPQLDSFLIGLPTAEAATVAWQPRSLATGEGLIIPSQVNYVGKGADLYQLGYKLHGSAIVISKYLGMSWLWEQVRQRGGAYGGFAAFDRRSGVFSYLSYRDPNLLKTLDAYDRTGDFLRRTRLDENDLTRAIIGAISDLDAYQLPDAKGYTSLIRYLTGDDDETRQHLRDEVLGTTAADFRRFGDTLDLVRESGVVVVLGGATAIEAAASEHVGMLEITKIL